MILEDSLITTVPCVDRRNKLISKKFYGTRAKLAVIAAANELRKPRSKFCRCTKVNGSSNRRKKEVKKESKSITGLTVVKQSALKLILTLMTPCDIITTSCAA